MKQATTVAFEGGQAMNTEKFEPDDPKTYEHLYTVSETKVEAVRRAMAGNPPIVVCTMQYVLQLLGLPS